MKYLALMALAAAQQSESQTLEMVDSSDPTSKCVMTWYTFADNGTPSIDIKIEMNEGDGSTTAPANSILMMSFEFGSIRSFYEDTAANGEPRTRYYFHAELSGGDVA